MQKEEEEPKEYHIRWMFLKLFVGEMIKNVKIKDTFEEDYSRELKDIGKLDRTHKTHDQDFKPEEKMTPSLKAIANPEPKIVKMKSQLSPEERNLPKRNLIPSMTATKKAKRKVPIERPLPGNIDLGKLNFLINDRKVQSIECPGPDKNVMIKKNGTVQNTGITLSSDEIQWIIEEFSRQTRIPLAGGVLKAALGRLIISAVTSNYVGSRFIVEKKRPGQRLI